MADGTISACLAEIKANHGKFYVYILSKPDGTPFYVGCGKVRLRGEQRIAFHERETRYGVESHKCNTIRKILASGGLVGYRIDGWYLSEHEMFAREVYLIAKIGRADKGRGPLTNWSDGGDGLVGRSDEVRERASRSMKPKFDAERRAAVSRRMKAHWDSPEGREKRLAANRDPEVRARRSIASAVAHQSESRKRKDAEIMAARWKDPDYRAKQCEMSKRLGSDPARKKAISENSSKRWSDPSYRERVSQSQRRAWQARRAAKQTGIE